jgi:hypothetical protein
MREVEIAGFVRIPFHRNYTIYMQLHYFDNIILEHGDQNDSLKENTAYGPVCV